MTRPSQARDALLDAYVQILIEDGERATTLNAVSKKAGISKGGLLYHFPSKEALCDGLLERVVELVREDAAKMSQAPEGPVSYFLRTSTFEDSTLDRTVIAVTRMAQSGSKSATKAIEKIRELWRGSIRKQIKDETTVEVIMLIGDGLYYNNALGSGIMKPESPEFSALMDKVYTLLPKQ